MPRDDWAKAASKAFGRRAKFSGNYFDREPSPKSSRRTKKCKNSLAVKRRRPPCICGSTEESTEPQRFKDGTVHIRVTCDACQSFKRWAKQ